MHEENKNPPRIKPYSLLLELLIYIENKNRYSKIERIKILKNIRNKLTVYYVNKVTYI